MEKMINQSEKRNNILFLLFYAIFFLLISGIDYFGIGIFIVILWILIYVEPIIYGFISKNAIKSFIFGFLFLPAMEIFDFIYSLSLDPSLDPSFAGNLSFLWMPKTFIISIVWGFAGFFASKRGNDKIQKIIYAACVLVFLLLEFVLTLKTY
ncbi:hypothetical protein [Methanolapillus millepedarum]|uniref:Uncharacterized protein n=1 Tax=Methanolapillus millepedarum TaxID=3028296 RepID=A0AA96V2L1_9EURY|nr:hypothetical protein MsAc7_09240 [Methanosarcinaceae archaeon Ac7]